MIFWVNLTLTNLFGCFCLDTCNIGKPPPMDTPCSQNLPAFYLRHPVYPLVATDGDENQSFFMGKHGVLSSIDWEFPAPRFGASQAVCPASVAGVLPLFQWAPHHLRLEEMGQPATDAPCEVGTYSHNVHDDVHMYIYIYPIRYVVLTFTWLVHL